MTRTSCIQIAIALTVSALTSGCAIFSSKDDAPAAQSAGFQGVAQTTAGSLPLPVEVAHDISRIYNGQEPAPETGPAPVDDFERVVSASSSREPASTSSRSAHSARSSRSSRRPAQAQSGGKEDSYIVKDGDTLMKISFEKYGNLYRWREIYDANKGKIGNYNKLEAGTVLNIHGVEYVVIEKNGKPYLIRRNDTLTKISNNVYGTTKEWRSIWNNNRQLIHDPNKIYAGFTLYYLPKDQTTEVREPSSVKRAPPAPKAVSKPTASAPSSTTGPKAIAPGAEALKKQVALVSDDPSVVPASEQPLPVAPPGAPQNLPQKTQ